MLKEQTGITQAGGVWSGPNCGGRDEKWLKTGVGAWIALWETGGYRHVEPYCNFVHRYNCMISCSGAYKSTSTQTLEHETGISPLSLYLDELALAQTIRSRDGPVAMVVEDTCQSIKEIARATLGTRGTAGPARRTLLRERATALLNYCPPTYQSLPERTRLRIAYRNKWKKRWTKFTSQGRQDKPVAQSTQWNPKIRQIHSELSKPQSTLATLLRTEHIGLEDFLSRRKVPGHPSPACPCGWHRQTPKHILLFCPHFQQGRAQMLQRAGTTDYDSLLSTKKGIKVATDWFLHLGLLKQFSLARELIQEDNQEEEPGGPPGPPGPGQLRG